MPNHAKPCAQIRIYLPQDAIAREKQLKNWRRDWKIRLIEENNLDCSELSRLL
jgi:putative endonuclease